MIIRYVEIRDSATFIPAVAMKMWPNASAASRYLLRRVGFLMPETSQFNVVLMRLGDMRAQYDPHAWTGRTMPVAHGWICDNFDAIEDGDVIDVEFILGETSVKKVSEHDQALR